jgi:hypothetical protein
MVRGATGCKTGIGHIEGAGDDGGGKISAQHSWSGNERVQGPAECSIGIACLVVILKTRPEGEVFVFVEVGAGYFDRPAERGSWIEILHSSLGNDGGLVIRKPVVRVEDCIPGVGVERSVVYGSTRLADSIDDDGAFGFIGAKVRGLHLDFLHLVHVDVGSCGSHVARIDDLGSV